MGSGRTALATQSPTPSVTSPDVAVIIGLALVVAVFAHQVLAPMLANRMARGRGLRPVREEAP